MWALSSTISSVPRMPRITSAISLAIVALGRYTASALADEGGRGHPRAR